MRHLRTHGNLCARAVRRFVEQPYVPLLYVLRARNPASGSVRRQVTGSLLRKGVVSYCTYKPGIKFKSAYRILGVVRGVLDGRGVLFCWDFWSVKKLFRWLTMRDVSLLDISAFFCFFTFLLLTTTTVFFWKGREGKGNEQNQLRRALGL